MQWRSLTLGHFYVRHRYGFCRLDVVTLNNVVRSCDIRVSTSSAVGSEEESMLRRAAHADLPPRAAASPGLLHRRYSVPETVMRR